MKLGASDIGWLAESFPGLVYRPKDNFISGILRIRGAFERESGQLKWGDIHEYGTIGTYLSGSFEIEIDLGTEDRNGWPIVHEAGRRCQEIAKQNRCGLIDLHLYEDGSCCLGLRLTRERNLTLRRLLIELVLPFFYRLSYVGLFGLSAARQDL